MSDDAQPTGRSPTPGPEAWAPLAAAICAMLLAALFIPGGPAGGREFCLDDAWIHLSYARSLRLGEGLSYNPRDWETGFSSPLWVLALSVWPLGADPVLPVKLLGLLLHGATAWLSAATALELGRQRASVSRPVPLFSVALLGGALVACSPTLLQGAVSGMEVPLAAALIMAASLAAIRRADGPAAVLGAMATLARPEALFCLMALSTVLAFGNRRLRDLSAGLGAAAGLGAWVMYCLAVSGHPFPNTQYVKGEGGGLDGLNYLTDQVLPWQPWLVSLSGVVMVGLALRDDLRRSPGLPGHRDGPLALPAEPGHGARPELLALMVAWLATVVAIAVSRPLHPGVLFFESRYFAPVAPLPAVVAALALARPRGWWAAGLILPLAIVTGLQVPATRQLTKAQERSVWRLHGLPARYLAAHLPPDAILAVEGAGAHRYFVPRSVRVVDVLGLNHGRVAHAAGDAEKACVIAREDPTHAILPEQLAGPLSSVFLMRPVQAFDDPAFAQVEEPHPVRVWLFEVDGLQPSWRGRCASDG